MACKILSALPATNWSARFCLVLAAMAGCTTNEPDDDDGNIRTSGSGGGGTAVPGVIGGTGGGGAGPVDPDDKPIPVVQVDELSCIQLFDCLSPCGDEACADPCIEQANDTSLNTFLGLTACAEAQACVDSACLEDECSLYLQACTDDAPVSPVDLGEEPPVVGPDDPACDLQNVVDQFLENVDSAPCTPDEDFVSRCSSLVLRPDGTYRRRTLESEPAYDVVIQCEYGTWAQSGCANISFQTCFGDSYLLPLDATGPGASLANYKLATSASEIDFFELCAADQCTTRSSTGFSAPKLPPD